MSEKIIVFGRDYGDIEANEDADVERAWFFNRPGEIQYGAHEVDVDQLQERLTTFLQRMNGVISELPTVLGEFRIESLQLSLEISAKGTVSLLGTGGEVGGTGGIQLTLTRQLQAGKPSLNDHP